MAHFNKRNSIQDHFLYPADHQEIKTNPPYFTWPKPTNSFAIQFELKDQAKKVIHKEITKNNLIELNRHLRPGKYTWSLTTPKQKISTFTFLIGSNTILFQPIQTKELLIKIPDQHPKHLWNDNYRRLLLLENGLNLKHLKNNLKQALKDEIPDRPIYHLIKDPILRSKEMTIFF